MHLQEIFNKALRLSPCLPFAVLFAYFQALDSAAWEDTEEGFSRNTQLKKSCVLCLRQKLL